MKNPPALLLILPLFALLFAGFFHPITSLTQDLGRHITTGNIITKTFSVPKTNVFSYTHPDFPFINHHWFSEVIFYGVFSATGFNGLLLTTTLTILAAFGLLVFSIRKKVQVIPVTIVSLLYFRVLFERTDLRPEIFSFLLLSIFITILYRFREHPTRLIFLLPLLELLWVNTHIYFFIGIVVIGLFLISVISRAWRLQSHGLNLFQDPPQTQMLKQVQHDKIKTLFFVFVASLFATFLNPNGISGALYPLQVFQNYGYQIEENQNIFLLWELFQKPTIVFFVLSVLFLFTSLLLSIRKTKPIDWLLAITFTLIGTLAIRNFPLFVFATFIPIATAFSLLYERLTKRFVFLLSPVVALFLLLFIVWQIVTVTQTKGFGLGVLPGATPAADFFRANNIQGPIFNNFDIGSYLDFRLYPQEKVFIDGRPEAYPQTFFQEVYIPMQQDQKIFNTVVQKYYINAIFFAHTDQTPWANTFLKAMMTNPNWQPVYLDDTVIIFVKKTARNKTLLTKFGMTPQTLTAKNIPLRNTTSLLYLASFYNKTGLIHQEKDIYQKMLAINPNDCLALQNLTSYLIQENAPATHIYQSRLQQVCQ